MITREGGMLGVGEEGRQRVGEGLRLTGGEGGNLGAGDGDRPRVGERGKLRAGGVRGGGKEGKIG